MMKKDFSMRSDVLTLKFCSAFQGKIDMKYDSISDIKAQVEAILSNNPPCDCGRPACVVCLAQHTKAILDSGSNPKNFQNQFTLKGNFQMSTENQQISERFVHGSAYRAEWEKNAALREEFEGDFEAYCHYQAAYSAGCVKTYGGVR